MTTFDDLTNEVQLNLLGFVADQEQITPTTASMSNSATSIAVADATQISTGLIEIDDELMWCDQVDPEANIVYTNIRGLYGSTAASHASGAIVRNAPRFPRFSIKRSINDTIRAVYPDLYGVGTTVLTASTATVTYALPSDVLSIIEITFPLADGSKAWWVPNRWRLNLNANTTDFPTGKTVDILDGIVSGRSINVTYRKVPSVLSAGTDNLTTTGLQDSAKECLVYGACSRLIGYTEPARMSDDSAEAKFIGTQTAGTATRAASYFYQMHLQAKAEETRRLNDRYPPRIHFTR